MWGRERAPLASLRSLPWGEGLGDRGELSIRVAAPRTGAAFYYFLFSRLVLLTTTVQPLLGFRPQVLIRGTGCTKYT